MSWLVLLLLPLALSTGVVLLWARAVARRREARVVAERGEARRRGSDKPQLLYPHVDLSSCLGCAACIEVCPEEGVLGLIRGQALVLHGARCVGHGACARACPTGAITVWWSELETRRDLPVLTEDREVPGSDGVFLAGEVTGQALVKSAIERGRAIVQRARSRHSDAAHDLVIVGAGPAGISAALEAKRLGLRAVLVEQESIGGTVAKYPRRKLVLTQPVDLPLHGRLERTSYSKEELMAVWEDLVEEHDLDVRAGTSFQSLERAGDRWRVHTSAGVLEGTSVCLAVGRRGSPRKLGVPGEERTKVAYSLIDAAAYTGRRILVVGGGDSAIEAALGLARQAGNDVTLSYRRADFVRLKPRNETRIARALETGAVRGLLPSDVVEIGAQHVVVDAGAGAARERISLPNDDVFVFAGGIPPFELLEAAGVSFDPAARPTLRSPEEQGRGDLLRALILALAASLLALGWAAFHRDYYLLEPAARVASPWFERLRSSSPVGLAFGVGSATCIGLNLAYLARRRWPLPGSLRLWLTLHIATGLVALMLAVLHAEIAPRATVGGFALAALVVLVTTGALGRYLYAFLPRSATGRELGAEESRTRLDAILTDLERVSPELAGELGRGFDAALDGPRGAGSLGARVRSVFGGRRALARALRNLRQEGAALGLSPAQLAEATDLARRALRDSFFVARFEELRAVVASWRYLHRWIALGLVLLVAIHVWVAWRYGGVAA
ncbi:MAG: NAD(P)-binding domain-containing protein [Planctomycetota bacterium]